MGAVGARLGRGLDDLSVQIGFSLHLVPPPTTDFFSPESAFAPGPAARDDFHTAMRFLGIPAHRRSRLVA